MCAQEITGQASECLQEILYNCFELHVEIGKRKIIMFVKGSHGPRVDFPSSLQGAKWMFWIKLINSSLKRKREGLKVRGGGKKSIFTSIVIVQNLPKGPRGFSSAEVCVSPASLHCKEQNCGSGTDGDDFSWGNFPLRRNGKLFLQSCKVRSGFKLFFTKSFFLQRSTSPTF